MNPVERSFLPLRRIVKRYAIDVVVFTAILLAGCGESKPAASVSAVVEPQSKPQPRPQLTPVYFTTSEGRLIDFGVPAERSEPIKFRPVEVSCEIYPCEKTDRGFNVSLAVGRGTKAVLQVPNSADFELFQFANNPEYSVAAIQEAGDASAETTFIEYVGADEATRTKFTHGSPIRVLRMDDDSTVIAFIPKKADESDFSVAGYRVAFFHYSVGATVGQKPPREMSGNATMLAIEELKALLAGDVARYDRLVRALGAPVDCTQESTCSAGLNEDIRVDLSDGWIQTSPKQARAMETQWRNDIEKRIFEKITPVPVGGEWEPLPELFPQR